MTDRTKKEHLDLCLCSECPLANRKETPLSKVLAQHGIEPAFSRILGLQVAKDPSKESPSVVVVGIYPAKEEARTGEPFTGKSGLILRSVMDQLGYQSYYLTNVLLCPIPEDLSSADQSKAIFCCSQRLESEIKDRTPELVIALGNIPLEATVNGQHKITEVSGRVRDGIYGPTLPIIHPAALVRTPEAFRDFVDQVDQGTRYLNKSYQVASKPEVIVANEDNFAEILNKLDKYPEMVVDLETTRKGFFPYNRDPDGIRCVVIAVDPSAAYIFPGESSEYYELHPDFCARQELKDMLKGKNLITHNGQFDIAFLMQKGYTGLNLYYDTLLAHVQIDERVMAHGLKHLAHKYLGAPDWEGDLKVYLPNKKSSYDLIPDDKLYFYAAYDVVFTYQLYQRFKTEINSGIFRDLIMPCANMFSELRHTGLRVDTEVLQELDSVLDTEFSEGLAELADLAGRYLSPTSPPEVAQLVYDELKLPMIGKYGRSTSAKVLEYYKDYPVIQSILDCRQLSKLRSTYVMGVANFVDRDLRIHPFTKLFGAVTGRISTENPSVMNVTKRRGGGIKKMYIPEDGHYIMEADQKQMELRCYVVIAKDMYLKNLLNESQYDRMKDPHRLVAATAFGIENADKKRGPAKTGVFGRLYGRQLASFVTGLKLSVEDAQHLIDIIDSMFPGLGQYNKDIKTEIHAQGYLESYFGRKRRFPLLTKETKNEAYRQGSNFKVQSMASDVNLYCMLHLYQMRKELGATPLFPVHDSVVFDLVSLDAIPRIKKEMETYSKELVHGEVDFVEEVKYGPNWGELTDWKEPK